MSEDVHVSVDDRSAEAELDRLLRITETGSEHLNRGMLLVKEEIRSHIHVLTGALKADVRETSHSFGPLWEGTVTIGAGLGYAVYEKDRKGVKAATGTPHDFIAASEEEAYATMVAAMLEALHK